MILISFFKERMAIFMDALNEIATFLLQRKPRETHFNFHR